MKEGFDYKKYIKIQSEKIRERFKLFDKLYLEFGGKILDDYHASSDESENENEEAQYTAFKIKQLINQGARASDFAVLMRLKHPTVK